MKHKLRLQYNLLFMIDIEKFKKNLIRRLWYRKEKTMISTIKPIKYI